MLEINDLNLSSFQLAEIDVAEDEMVEAWLKEASGAHVTSPASLFLWGLRSGRLPDSGPRLDTRAREILQAERWIRNVGYLLDREAEVIDELFGRNGPLRDLAGDLQLQERMLALWDELRPKGMRAEQEFLERAARNAVTYNALLKGVKRDDGPERAA